MTQAEPPLGFAMALIAASSGSQRGKVRSLAKSQSIAIEESCLE